MKLTLIERKNETTDVSSFVFRPEDPLAWKPGQFLHYVLHHEPTDDRGSDRWFTVASAPHEGHVMITTRFNATRSSSFKKSLRDLKSNDTIEVSDLDGDFIVDDLTRPYVFIAGGIGITPFRSMLKHLDHEGRMPSITLLYANRDEQVVYKDELEAIAARHPQLVIHYLFAPARIDEASIRKDVSNIHAPVFYVSGPEPMVEAMGELLKGMGVSTDHIKQDWFPGYPAE